MVRGGTSNQIPCRAYTYWPGQGGADGPLDVDEVTTPTALLGAEESKVAKLRPVDQELTKHTRTLQGSPVGVPCLEAQLGSVGMCGVYQLGKSHAPGTSKMATSLNTCSQITFTTRLLSADILAKTGCPEREHEDIPT